MQTSRAAINAMVWEHAARQLYAYVQEHVRIVGWREIDAWYEAKKAYDEANQTAYANLSVQAQG